MGGLEGVDLRDDEVVGELRRVGGQDPDRTVLGEHGGRVGGTAAQSDGDGLTDTAGQRQQLQRGLADGTVHVVDIDEYFSHGTSISCVRGERGR